MNSELKEQVLEALRIGESAILALLGGSHHNPSPRCDAIRATIAAVEAEPEPTQKLTADQIESCFPDGGDTNENGVTVSAQWLHDFARNVESKVIVTPVRVWNERDVEIVRTTRQSVLKEVYRLYGGTSQDMVELALNRISPQTILDSLKGK